MFTLTAFSYKRWRIEKGNIAYLDGIGELGEAIKLAPQHGIAIDIVKTKQYLRAA